MKRTMPQIALIASMVGLLLLVFASRRDQSGIVPKVHAKSGCSVETMNGAYGFYRTGTFPAGPTAAVGVIRFDGEGSVTGWRQTVKVNGVTTSDLFTTPPRDGAYEVDADCKGRILSPNPIAHIVVVEGGKEVFLIGLPEGITVFAVLKKIDFED